MLFNFYARCKEFEAKIEVMMRSKHAADATISDKVSQLEKALEEVICGNAYSTHLIISIPY